ncbi:MAG TPA: vWA domain-containing protein [Kofleriaceae bacterium]|nr:vWA domain-containing protein [Kofleriaceae bacterium]
MRHLLIALVALGCGRHHDPAAQPDAPASGCTTDSDCGSGMTCSDGQCIGGCGGTVVDLTYVPPDLLFVLDRSCSMTQLLSGTQTSKWQAAVAAISDVLATYATEIRWGATLFPDTTGDKCTQDAIPMPVGDNNAGPLSTLLNAALDPSNPLYPSGPCVTNIDTGLEQAATDPGLQDPARKSYLMLVTDGGQSGCSAGGGDTGSENAVSSLHAMGVDTFVVGFGSQVKSQFLDTLAADGGQALTGGPHGYYQADTAADLDQAFQTIGSLVVSCDYHVDPPPPDLDQTYVFFDKITLVPRDQGHADGWDYDPTTQTLTLYGPACDQLKSHQVQSLDLVFGCPTPPIL